MQRGEPRLDEPTVRAGGGAPHPDFAARPRGQFRRAPLPIVASYGGGRHTHKENGQLVIGIRSHRFFVSLHQRDDYTPHTPTPKELEEQRTWEWRRPSKWDTTPANG
ncbi:hypothetical protein AB4Z09_27290 [Rhodococcus sp. TAF43]|uniref:hypothetical protein n=1 Tax=Rhodococcus sp. TAF43 TaxID=3237483 RepID=UPI003F9A5E39